MGYSCKALLIRINYCWQGIWKRFPFLLILQYIYTTDKMNIIDLVTKTRTFRRFDESYKIDYNTLEQLIGLARLSASGANRQPLKFLLCNTPEECARIFPFTAWAGYLAEWKGPEPGERPVRRQHICLRPDTAFQGCDSAGC